MEGFRTASDGAKLFTRRWVPDGVAKGSVLVLHGVCEHSGRYERVAKYLGDGGYIVSSLDLRGHGRSPGRRGDARFEPTLRDIDELLEEERTRGSGGPRYLYGQSLGGLLALTYVLDRRPSLAGVVASAPVLHTSLSDRQAKVFVARALGAIAPGLGMPAGLDDTKLMRDQQVLADRRRDPLVHDRITAGLARDALAAAARILEQGGDISIPLLLIHGDADQINRLSGSQALASKAKGDCTLNVYADVLHHPHNDPERDVIFADVVGWLTAHP